MENEKELLNQVEREVFGCFFECKEGMYASADEFGEDVVLVPCPVHSKEYAD